MSAKLLLRIASLLMLIHLIGHSIGHSGWKKESDPVKSQVIGMMTGPKFPFMGVNRSMGDYFDGYGYIASVTLLLIVLILWICSNGVVDPNRQVKQILLTVGSLLVVIGLLEIRFFFPFAAGISLLAGLLVIGARLRIPGVGRG